MMNWTVVRIYFDDLYFCHKTWNGCIFDKPSNLLADIAWVHNFNNNLYINNTIFIWRFPVKLLVVDPTLYFSVYYPILFVSEIILMKINLMNGTSMLRRSVPFFLIFIFSFQTNILAFGFERNLISKSIFSNVHSGCRTTTQYNNFQLVQRTQVRYL